MALKRKKTTKKKAVKKTAATGKTAKKKTVKKKAAKKKPARTVAVKSKTARKKTAKKKAAGRLTRPRGLNAADRERFKEMLLQKRREIFQNMFEIEGETLKKSRLDASGDLSSMPIHMADLGTDNYEQEFALGLMDSERRLLTEIDEALLRIEDGSYGICQGTGKPIRKARLEAQPWAQYSVEYARMIEQGLVDEVA
ncbi:MAG: TraR/DksA C4-type zinc finger protein [Sedimentisphaerales bacterium]|nr:TraR/DksA C4-type zinc finger protein [Sedimentisphaerales bacterium]